MNWFRYLYVYLLLSCAAVFIWAAVMSVVDYRRTKKQREQWLREILDDLEER